MPKGYKKQEWNGKVLDIIESWGSPCLICGAEKGVDVRFKRSSINESIIRISICAACRRAIISDLAETIWIDSEI